MAEVLFRAKLTRDDSNTPWGFRLQGGADYDKPLTLLKVTAESVASRGGLHPGDIVVKLGGKSSDGMTHKDAQEAIIASGNALEIIVERAEEVAISPTSGEASPPTIISEDTPAVIQYVTETGAQDTSAKVLPQARESSKPPSVPPPSSTEPVPVIRQTVSQNASAPAQPADAKALSSAPAAAAAAASASSTTAAAVKPTAAQTADQQKSKTLATHSVDNSPVSAKPAKSKAAAVAATLNHVDNNKKQAHIPTKQVKNSTKPTVVLEPKQPPVPAVDASSSHQTDISSRSQSSSKSESKPVSTSTPNTPMPVKPASKPSVTKPNAKDLHTKVPPLKVSAVESKVKVTDDSDSHVNVAQPEIPMVEVVQVPPEVKEEKLLTTADETKPSRNRVPKVSSPPATAPWRKPKDVSSEKKPEEKTVTVQDVSTSISKSQQNQLISDTSKRIPIPVVHTTTKPPEGTTQKKDYSKVAPWRTGQSAPVQSNSNQSVTKLQPSVVEKVSSVPKQNVPSSESTDPVHPWRRSHKTDTSGAPMDSIHARAKSAPVTSFQQDRSTVLTGVDSKTLPASFSNRQDNIDQSLDKAQPVPVSVPNVPTSEPSLAAEPELQPGLTFIGRRIESPTKGPGSPVTTLPTKTPFAHLKQEGRGSPLAFSQTEPRDSPVTTGQSFVQPIPVLTRQALLSGGFTIPMLRVSGNEMEPEPGEEYSPNPDDIFFAAASPDLVDIPMPAVKEMVADLNRRLEAIAAQQPRITQVPTAQEVGLSFLRKDIKALQKSLAEAGEGQFFLDENTLSSQAALESIKQRLFGRDASDSSTLQKIYDVTSPFNSPPPHRKKFVFNLDRSPSPRSARHVHFADPPEQSVIEIEPNLNSRRKIRREEEPQEYPSPYVLAEKLEREAQSLALPINKPRLISPPPPSLVSAQPASHYLSPPLPTSKPNTQYLSSPTRSEPYYLTPSISVSTRPIDSQYLSPSSVPVRTEVPVTHHISSTRPESSPISHFLSPIPTERLQPTRDSLAQVYSYLESREPVRTGISSVGSPLDRLSPGRQEVRQLSPSRSQGLPSTQAQQSPAKINVSITHKRGDLQPPTQFKFTIPPGQPGQPSYFHYTVSPKKPPSEPFALSYSFPPSYEESMRNRQQRTLDDSRLSYMYGPRPLDPSLYLRTSAGPLSPPMRRTNSPLYVNTTAGGYYSPSPSPPVFMSPGVLSSPRVRLEARPRPRPTSPLYMDTIQSKSFRESHMGSGGKPSAKPVPVSVEVPVRPPGQVPQPAPVSRTFTPTQFDEPNPGALARLGSPALHAGGPAPSPGAPSPATAGLFALFDKSFTEKFLQWQSQRDGSLYESETYRLVREMDDETKHGTQ